MNSLSLGKWFGTEVILHWSWMLTIVFMLAVNPTAIPNFIGLFIIILLHEFGHILTGKYLGLEVVDITLTPIGGLASFQDITYKTEFWTTVAGPAVNVALIPLTLLLMNYYPSNISYYLVMSNMGLLIFNMLPIFPMDGGRILRSSYYYFTDDILFSTKRTVIISKIFIVLASIVLIIDTNIIGMLIMILFWFCGDAELRKVMDGTYKRELKSYQDQADEIAALKVELDSLTNGETITPDRFAHINNRLLILSKNADERELKLLREELRQSATTNLILTPERIIYLHQRLATLEQNENSRTSQEL